MGNFQIFEEKYYTFSLFSFFDEIISNYPWGASKSDSQTNYTILCNKLAQIEAI